MIEPNYLPSKEAAEQLHITQQTLWNWKADRKIKYIQLSARKILYDINSIIPPEVILEKEKRLADRKNVAYCRVSSTIQKDDLARQIELVKSYMISNGSSVDEVYSDIGSGMNENRAGLKALLKDITDNKINKVYITYKDRLTRFGYGYFEYLCSLYDVEIIVLDNTTSEDKDRQQELTNDLIAIIHHYSTNLDTSRRSKFKKITDLLEEDKYNSSTLIV